MKIIKTNCYKGTVIRYGNEKRILLNRMTEYLMGLDYIEINASALQIPLIFAGKIGEENNNLMYQFEVRGRETCLAPEYTAVFQRLATIDFKFQKDVKLFYIQQCFRGERQQRGRWRELTQLAFQYADEIQN